MIGLFGVGNDALVTRVCYQTTTQSVTRGVCAPENQLPEMTFLWFFGKMRLCQSRCIRCKSYTFSSTIEATNKHVIDVSKSSAFCIRSTTYPTINLQPLKSINFLWDLLSKYKETVHFCFLFMGLICYNLTSTLSSYAKICHLETKHV